MEELEKSTTSEKPENGSNGNPEQLKREFSGFLATLRDFVKDVLDIRAKTDVENTKKMIIDDIPFKGHTAWVLVCSIMIASIGLNANSAPVVIGAMLISPLMGPILGIGMAIATNDIATLRRALKNFGVMVVLSVLTAFLFFWVFPLKEDSSELLARTAPDVRDVLIAFFGGLALIIARTKEGTIASVIFGVAIATALMPPLCTAGYGLAIWKPSYFFGAMYLFIINTIFIALATFLVLKILRFPMVRYANSIKRKRTAQAISVVAFLVILPAMYTFYHVFQKSHFNAQAKRFIEDVIKQYELPEGGVFADGMSKIVFDKERSMIELFFIGEDVVPENVQDTWRNIKNADSKYSQLREAELIVRGGISHDGSGQQLEYVKELYESKKAEIANKDERIRILESEVARLKTLEREQVPLQDILAEARINYDSIAELGFYNLLKSNFETMDTIPTFQIKWKPGTSADVRSNGLGKIRRWLAYRMDRDSIRVLEIN